MGLGADLSKLNRERARLAGSKEEKRQEHLQ